MSKYVNIKKSKFQAFIGFDDIASVPDKSNLNKETIQQQQ